MTWSVSGDTELSAPGSHHGTGGGPVISRAARDRSVGGVVSGAPGQRRAARSGAAAGCADAVPPAGRR